MCFRRCCNVMGQRLIENALRQNVCFADVHAKYFSRRCNVMGRRFIENALRSQAICVFCWRHAKLFAWFSDSASECCSSMSMFRIWCHSRWSMTLHIRDELIRQDLVWGTLRSCINTRSYRDMLLSFEVICMRILDESAYKSPQNWATCRSNCEY